MWVGRVKVIMNAGARLFGTSLMQPEIEVEISNTQSHLEVEAASLDRLVRIVLAAQHRPRASISIALVDNATIHGINQAHLGHDWPTDVITFPLSDPDEPVLAGELVVSTEMACSSAREFGVEPALELSLYVVHGLLHLCGFDDHDDSARRTMRRREDELLSQAGFASPYARERVAAQADPELLQAEPLADRETWSSPARDRSAGPRLAARDLECRPWKT
jgi:probable rRNA maturation factor